MHTVNQTCVTPFINTLFYLALTSTSAVEEEEEEEEEEKEVFASIKLISMFVVDQDQEFC